MADISIPIGLADTALAILFTVVSGLLGKLYRNITDEIDEHEQRLDDVERQAGTVFAWAFGNEADKSDEGFAGDVSGKLNELDARQSVTESNASEEIDELQSQFDELTVRLEAEESLDFRADDID
jgi:hypothetical protein